MAGPAGAASDNNQTANIVGLEQLLRLDPRRPFANTQDAVERLLPFHVRPAKAAPMIASRCSHRQAAASLQVSDNLMPCNQIYSISLWPYDHHAMLSSGISNAAAGNSGRC